MLHAALRADLIVDMRCVSELDGLGHETFRGPIVLGPRRRSVRGLALVATSLVCAMEVPLCETLQPAQ